MELLHYELGPPGLVHLSYRKTLLGEIISFIDKLYTTKTLTLDFNLRRLTTPLSSDISHEWKEQANLNNLIRLTNIAFVFALASHWGEGILSTNV
jgi:hypothetical protein